MLTRQKLSQLCRSISLDFSQTFPDGKTHNPAMKFTSLHSLRALSLLGLAMTAVSCVSNGPPYPADGNVFINDRRPRYGYQGTNTPTPDNPGPEEDRPKRNERGEDPEKLHDNQGPLAENPHQSDAKPDKPVADPAPTTPTETKPKPTTTLPYGTPVIGKKGFVYSPYAPDKGMVDVTDIPSGTKVACPYTDKVFRVP